MCYGGLEADEAVLAAKFAVMRPVLDERAGVCTWGRRRGRWGDGGIAAVARAAGASETTVAAGVRREAGDPADAAGAGPVRGGRAPAGRRRRTRSPG